MNEMEAELRYGSRCARPSDHGVRHVCDESRLWREMVRGGGDDLSGTHERGGAILDLAGGIIHVARKCGRTAIGAPVS